MCDVPSIAVFCSESIECFPGTGFKFFLKLLVTIPLALIITGTIVHFRFHIRCISIHKHLYFNFFSASFRTTFLSAGIATSISVHYSYYYYYHHYHKSSPFSNYTPVRVFLSNLSFTRIRKEFVVIELVSFQRTNGAQSDPRTKGGRHSCKSYLLKPVILIPAH